MPSTRKQKAKERRSRQLDILSDVENVDVMLGSFSGNIEGNDHSENELNLNSESSRLQRNSNVTGEDFRSLLTNSRENSEITIETTRFINDEIFSQLSRKLNEIKTSLNSQIQNAISAAITNTVLLSIQNTLNMQGEPNFSIVDPRSNEPHQGSKAASLASKDLRSSERQRNPGAEITQETWGKRSKTSPVEGNHRHMPRDSSVDSYNSEQNHDSYIYIVDKKDLFEMCYWFGFLESTIQTVSFSLTFSSFSRSQLNVLNSCLVYLFGCPCNDFSKFCFYQGIQMKTFIHLL